MTLPQRLITEPRTEERGLNELTEDDVIQAVAQASGVQPGTELDKLRRDGILLTGKQLAALAKKLQERSTRDTARERTEALGDADVRWRERLDLAVEALNIAALGSADSSLAAIARAVAVGTGKTNLRVTLEQQLNLKGPLAEVAADAAIAAILNRLAFPLEAP